MNTFNSSDSGDAAIAAVYATVTPSGVLSLPLYGVASLLSQSAAFQSWVGAGSAEQAMNAIFFIAPDASGVYPDAVTGASQWPFAVLNLGRTRRNLRGSGASPLFAPNAEVEIYLEAKNIPVDRDRSANPALSFLNAVGGIVTDLESASQGDGALQILSQDIEKPDRPQVGWLGTVGDFYTIEIIATVGFR